MQVSFCTNVRFGKLQTSPLQRMEAEQTAAGPWMKTLFKGQGETIPVAIGLSGNSWVA